MANANKNHVGENAVQRMVRLLKGLNQELVKDGETERIELRINVGQDTGELVYIDIAKLVEVRRLIAGPLEVIEEFLAASPLERLLMVRADGENAR